MGTCLGGERDTLVNKRGYSSPVRKRVPFAREKAAGAKPQPPWVAHYAFDP